ncbi:hypothetical protein PVK06_023576 [Gossypium arboreum]|uniref:Endonuclease/exonuclease/phosphatase domain-containing protein n=1 Tax=Gossypium arboreum TaxID=29729 RepID=A0ABR0PBQ5_GOSAR|nr:hypothetical protein PVK06_023576 [Gossypium arboreum]
MMVDSSPMSRVSWKEKLLEGKGFESCNGVTNANLEIEYGNILRSSINGIPAIDFSKKVKRDQWTSTLSVEQELLDLGHDLARDRLVLGKDVGSKSNGVQLILTAKQNMENLESMERTVQMGPKIVFQNKHSSLHFNPTFEGSLELLVHVNPKFLDFDQYLAVIFKEYSEYNSKATVENLHITIPVDGSPWMAIGDFNAILSSTEKRRERTLLKMCPLFGGFMESAQLQDLGFRGSQFIWQRGGSWSTWLGLFATMLGVQIFRILW